MSRTWSKPPPLLLLLRVNTLRISPSMLPLNIVPEGVVEALLQRLHLPSLQEVDLNNWLHLQDRHLLAFRALPCPLRSLRIFEKAYVSSAAVLEVQSFYSSTLRTLHCQHLINPALLQMSERCTALEHIRMPSLPVRSADAIQQLCLRNAGHLLSVHLPRLPPPTDEHDTIAVISKACSKLQSIQFAYSRKASDIVVANSLCQILTNCADITFVHIPRLASIHINRNAGEVLEVHWNDKPATSMQAVLECLEFPVCKLWWSFTVQPTDGILHLAADRYGRTLHEFTATMPDVSAAAVKYFLSRCNALTALRLVLCAALSDELLAHLPTYCPHLHTLEVRTSSTLSDEGWIVLLEGYKQANLLRSLAICNCPEVTNTVLEHIAAFDLDDLNVIGTAISPATVQQLLADGHLHVKNWKKGSSGVTSNGT